MNRVSTTVFLSIPISENLKSDGVFRPERRIYYETIIGSIIAKGLDVACAALNEEWGALKLPRNSWASWDLEAIDNSDALLVLSTTRISSDIYLEVGLAVSSGKRVDLVLPWEVKGTYMLQGLAELGHLAIHHFDSEEESFELVGGIADALITNPNRSI